MASHKAGTKEEWLAARLDLLKAEKALAKQAEKLAQQRRVLPRVRVTKEYRFETDEGTATLAELFGGRPHLVVYHFMFGPDFTAGCPTCTSIANTFNGLVPWLANQAVTLCAVSQAPLAKLRAYKERMGWGFPWVSAVGADFKHDFQGAFAEDEELAKEVQPYLDAGQDDWAIEWARGVGVDWATYRREMAGISSFTVDAGVLYYIYASYESDLDEISILDRIQAILSITRR